MSLASAALELSATGVDGLTTTGAVTMGTGRVATGVIITIWLVIVYYFGNGSARSTTTYLNYLIRSRVFMS